MKILHVVPGLGETGNGIAVAAKMIAEEQGGELLDCSDCSAGRLRDGDYDEVWVHSMWLPQTILACWTVIRSGRKLVRMPHGCLDPVRLGYHGWKKRLIAPVERWIFRRTDRVVVTCEAEREWVREYLGANSDERRNGVPKLDVLDLKRFFRLEGKTGKEMPAVEVEGPQRSLHLLYLGRRHPLKGVEHLEEAVKEIQPKSGIERRKADSVIVRDEDRRVAALRKIDEWLWGVDGATFDEALVRLVNEKTVLREYRFREDGDQAAALAGARRFFVEFSRKIVELSDGRCVYFAPDVRAKRRNGSNVVSWAEYAFHAVSNGGAKLAGKDYHERWYNPYKVSNMDLIEPTLLAEQCVPVLKRNYATDAIKFFGQTHESGNFDVVVRLDECGNAAANMTEVTFEASTRKIKPPRLVPLTEAVQTVVYHQTTAGSYSSDNGMLSNSRKSCKGEEDETQLKSDAEVRTRKVELRIVSDHFGEELERDWEWCDVLCLPTLSENFGLVVAEALERGKRVVVTDGAPAWAPPGESKKEEGKVKKCGRLIYLRGYREGTDEERVRLLKEAIGELKTAFGGENLV